MPIKYIGRLTDFKGKSLWEILGNLKNNGVGRMVIRSRFQRYPEACYMRILKVAALPNTIANPHDSRKVIALVERTFRGKTDPKPVQIDSASYKADYVLIPKDQEVNYLSATNRPAEKVMPRDANFPPLLRELLVRQARFAGKLISEEPKLELRYNLDGVKNYRVAGESEKPTVNIPVNLEPKLYCSNVKSEKTSQK